MKSWKSARARRYTRRRTLGAGARLGMGLIVTRQAPIPALAQAAPPASPVTASGYTHPEMVIDGPSLMTRRDDQALALIALMPAEEFARGHIPGSVQVDWPAMEILDTSDAGIAAWREDMARLLAALGISRERAVVTYDGETLFATRPWWLLHYLGHPDARVLDGGLAAWEAAGGEITTGPAPAASPATVAAKRYEATPRPETLAPFAEVRASLEDPNAVLVDARTPEEFAEGHIPGAVNINFPRNAVDGEPRVFKSQDALRALYEDAGVTIDKRVIPYCSTGVRSSVTYFALRLIGYDDVALYTGSWEEWSRHPEAPKATGSEP